MDILMMENNENFELLKNILSPADCLDIDDDSSSDTSCTSSSSYSSSASENNDYPANGESSSEEETFDTCSEGSSSLETLNTINLNGGILRQRRLIQVMEDSNISSETCPSDEEENSCAN